jgi:hypothetical protein
MNTITSLVGPYMKCTTGVADMIAMKQFLGRSITTASLAGSMALICRITMGSKIVLVIMYEYHYHGAPEVTFRVNSPFQGERIYDPYDGGYLENMESYKPTPYHPM